MFIDNINKNAPLEELKLVGKKLEGVQIIKKCITKFNKTLKVIYHSESDR